MHLHSHATTVQRSTLPGNFFFCFLYKMCLNMHLFCLHVHVECEILLFLITVKVGTGELDKWECLSLQVHTPPWTPYLF